MTTLSIALLSLTLSVIFIGLSYWVSKRQHVYFNIQSSIFLIAFLAISGFFNGYAWYKMSPDHPSIVFLLFGLMLEFVKPVLVQSAKGRVYVYGLIFALAAFSIGSATTTIYKNINESNRHFINVSNENQQDQIKVNQLSSQSNPYVLSKQYEGQADSDLLSKVTSLKGVKAIPSNAYRAKHKYWKPTLNETVYQLTKSCGNTTSEYFGQGNICADIQSLEAELEHRGKALEWTLNQQSQLDQAKPKGKELIVQQNEWVEMINFIRHHFDNNIQLDIPRGQLEMYQFYEQSSASAKMLALFIGVLLEAVLIILSLSTYREPPTQHGQFKTMIKQWLSKKLETRSEKNVNAALPIVMESALLTPSNSSKKVSKKVLKKVLKKTKKRSDNSLKNSILKIKNLNIPIETLTMKFLKSQHIEVSYYTLNKIKRLHQEGKL